MRPPPSRATSLRVRSSSGRPSRTSSPPAGRPGPRSPATPPPRPGPARPARSAPTTCWPSGPHRRPAGPGPAHRPDLAAPGLRRRAPAGDGGCLPRRRRQPGGHRPIALRAHQHGPLPAERHREGHRLQPHRPPRRVHRPPRPRLGSPDRAPRQGLVRARDPALDRHTWRNSPKPRPIVRAVRSRHGNAGPGRLEPCSSSPVPVRARRLPASSHPGSSSPVCASGRSALRRRRHRPPRPRDDLRRGDDQGHRRRPAAHRGGRPAGVPVPLQGPVDLSPVGALAGHSVGEITAAAAGRRPHRRRRDGLRPRTQPGWPRRAPSPTGMSAVLGGDPDDVLATIERHGLTPANVNAKGQVVAAGTLEQLAALAADPPAKARVIPLKVAGAFHTSHMAPALERLSALAGTITERPGGDPGVQRATATSSTAAPRCCPPCQPGDQPGSLGPLLGDVRHPRRHRPHRAHPGRDARRTRETGHPRHRDPRPEVS